MKKLRINFTTPEQSKRLLDLGLPLNSADCAYYSVNGLSVNVYGLGFKDCLDRYVDKSLHYLFKPSWSAGRLIEIYTLVTGRTYNDGSFEGETLIDRLEFAIADASHMFDFSKLDE